MRRATTLLIGCLLLAACSGGDAGESTDTAVAGSTSDTAGSTDDAAEPTIAGGDGGASGGDGGDEPSGSSVPDTTAPSGEFVELPGLIDESDEPIPDDDAVITGELANGLRYYIRENDNPGAKADLRLAVRAGSVDEFEPPTGVAHFLEHMLFNGTEQFPENELISVLRSFGASFGPDINAYTSFDETVYSLVVPNSDAAVGLGLDVLAEWLSSATIAEADVVSERGVVLDEWRVRTQSTDGRLFAVAEEMYLDGTAYEGRTPIGTSASIEAMTSDDLRPFYDGWYRPENVALIVVGDVDADEIEREINERFGDVASRTEAPPNRPDTSFGLDTEPDYRLHSDPDQTTVDVEVTLPLPAFEGEGTAAQRAALIDYMIYDVLVRRLTADVAAGEAPFDDIAPGTNSFVSGLDAPALYAFTDADRVTDTLEALIDEYHRTFLYGFTADEVDTARSSLESAFRTRYEGRESTQDREYADSYVENFLRDTAYPSIADEYEISSAILAGITPEALAERFAARWSNSAPHVIISSPESQADQMPDADTVLAIITAGPDVSSRGAGRDLPDELMARPDPVDPASSRTILDEGFTYFDPIEIEYPNGVRVRLNPNEIVEGQLFFQAGSRGGSSLVADEDVPDSLYAADIVTSGGVSDFNQSELIQMLSGTDAQVGAYLTPYDERLFGASSTSDVETLLQLVHLYMTEPRFDQVALNQVVAAEGPVVADPSTEPRAAGTDALLDTRYDDEPRYTLIPTPEEFDTLDLAGVERVWDDRFGDASDWVFVFSGDFDRDDLLELSSSYLGTLPGSGRIDESVDVTADPPAAPENEAVRAGTGDTASTLLLFTSEVPEITSSLRAQADVVTALLQARLSEVVREEFGETYSPYADSYVDTDPGAIVETYVEVSGSPTRIEQIGDLILDELADLAANGPTDAEFAAAYAEVEETYNFVDNNQFLDALLEDAIDPALPLSGYLGEYDSLPTVTADSVREYLAAYVPTDRYVEVAVTPR